MITYRTVCLPNVSLSLSLHQCLRTRCVRCTGFRRWTVNGCWFGSRWRSVRCPPASRSSSSPSTFRRTPAGKSRSEPTGGSSEADEIVKAAQKVMSCVCNIRVNLPTVWTSAVKSRLHFKDDSSSIQCGVTLLLNCEINIIKTKKMYSCGGSFSQSILYCFQAVCVLRENQTYESATRWTTGIFINAF